ncbi:Multicopper oxidase [Fimbriimonas ginsengisoli Gsoil 348]|uniref:Multicopper oxidase n=1 Tax=Fimbriimonas ginsengisoli Gsoil 348 TaxID=661478 RepID=A0A068NTD8_FIMGI|nr:Multicopper oxidase [Fimbriimonas ginsengisoli Gsoil 348]
MVDVHNDTPIPEQLHWHGQRIPVSVDGSAEEGTPYIPAGGMRRIEFIPGPAGFRFYHTHNIAGADLNAGQYTGQVGPVYIEPKNEPGAYDREVFLTLKEFAPSFSKGGDMAMDFLSPAITAPDLKARAEHNDRVAKGKPKGYEVGYDIFTINGKMLGHSEPIRVKRGQRVLFHVLNGSAGEIRSLALPGHHFKVVALDGNPVPHPVSVPVLYIGTAERVSAIVEMDHPGVWVMGDLSDDDRNRGMGIVVEYAGSKGKPKWEKPAPFHWDYTRFGRPGGMARKPDETFVLTFEKQQAAEHGFNRWTINGKAFAMQTMSNMDMGGMEPLLRLKLGNRYRLRMRNASDDIHPMHLHRHSFELTRFAGKPTAGVHKDVVMVGGFQEVDIDFTADQPGLSLFHCHQQLHMDYGFMALFACS